MSPSKTPFYALFINKYRTHDPTRYSDRRERQRRCRANDAFPSGSSDYMEKRDAFVARDGWKLLWEAHVKRRHESLFDLARLMFRVQHKAAEMQSDLREKTKHDIVANARAILCTVASTGSLMRVRG